MSSQQLPKLYLPQESSPPPRYTLYPVNCRYSSKKRAPLLQQRLRQHLPLPSRFIESIRSSPELVEGAKGIRDLNPCPLGSGPHLTFSETLNFTRLRRA